MTSVDFDNAAGFDLLACTETNNEEIESTGGTTAGSDVAEVPVHSRVVAAKLRLFLQGQGGEFIRWALVKNPDNEFTTQNFIDEWHTSNDSPNGRLFREKCLSKGLALLQSDRLSTAQNVFIRRKALARNARFIEGDRWKMVFAKDATATTCQATLWGTIYVKANA